MNKIPKTLLQSSKYPYPDYVRRLWDERTGGDWKVEWFDDARIYKFFEDNPLPEFPKIKQVFDSFSDGGHKADLFRYYYLYLNGGYFIDSDVMTHVHMDEIHSSVHDHVFVFADVACNRVCHPEIDSPIIFNGLMGCAPKSKIVYEALKNAYNVKIRLLEKQRLYFVYMLYVIAEQYKDQYNILWFNEGIDDAASKFSYTCNQEGKRISTHYFGEPKRVPKNLSLHGANHDPDDILFFTTFNKDGYKLYGRAWIKTFLKVAETNPKVRARIYCEGFEPEIQDPRIESVQFSQAIPNHRAWKIAYLKFNNHMKYTRDMTVRFSHKAFVIHHAVSNPSSRYTVWVDGDCVFKDADFSSFGFDLTQDKLLACQVERLTNSNVCHVESGVLVFDTTHPDRDRFIQTYIDCYDPKTIIKMPNDNWDTKAEGTWQEYGPYDGFIFHKALSLTGVKFHNLNESLPPIWSPAGTPELTFAHPDLSSRFVHNIGHDGKNKYVEVNNELDIDSNFEWSHHLTNELSNLDNRIVSGTEVVTARYRGEFPFVIHTPELDTVISGDICIRGWWEAHISDIIIDSMTPGGIFVDIGANIGWHSKVVQNAGFDVIAFEPTKVNYDVLVQNCTKEGSVLHNTGLSNKTDVVSMHVNPKNYGDAGISHDGDRSVNVVRLDDIFDDGTIEKINVVKMDVQGHETKIIEGGLEFFKKLKPGTTMIIEVSLFSSGFDMKLLVRELAKRASKVYALCRWHDNKPISLSAAINDVMTNPDDVDYQEFDLVIVK